ncbi:hypothetical protein [Paraburkholderia rhynchosiae]
MRDRFFCSADGELLIVPHRGRMGACAGEVLPAREAT